MWPDIRMRLVTKAYLMLPLLLPSKSKNVVVGSANNSDDDDEFSSSLVQDLIERLQSAGTLPLSLAEKAQLATVALAALEASHATRC